MKLAFRHLMALPFLAGCAATPMPESHYAGFGTHALYLQRCFEQGFITPQMYADSMYAVAYQLNTWSWEEEKLAKTMADIDPNIQANVDTCRQTEAVAYQRIASVERHTDDAKAEQQSRESKQGDSVICSTFGTTTFCH